MAAHNSAFHGFSASALATSSIDIVRIDFLSFQEVRCLEDWKFASKGFLATFDPSYQSLDAHLSKVPTISGLYDDASTEDS